MLTFDAVAIGELLIDFTPAPLLNETKPHFALNPGGAPANVMAAIQKLGGQTGFIGKVGKDNFGQFLKGTLQKANISTLGLLFDIEVPTTLAFVTLDDRGERSFSFYRNPGADIMLKAEEIPLNMIEETEILHFGSVSLTNSPSKEATMFAVERAKKMGKIITYDPNYRPPLWKNEQEAIEMMKWGLSKADIIKVSEEEMELLTNTNDIQKGGEILIQNGAVIVLISAGSKGSYYATQNFSGYIPAYKVESIDTNGAGDAFFGAFLYTIRTLSLEKLKELTQEKWERNIKFANAAGAITTTRGGAIPALPTVQEVIELIETNS